MTSAHTCISRLSLRPALLLPKCCHITVVFAVLLLLQGGLPAAWGNVTFPDYNPNNQNNGSQPGPKAMQSLAELICNNCSLSGELPFAWNNMQRLRRISLTDNNFNGSIPNLGAWQLEELLLDRNSFGSWLSPGFAGAWQMLRRLSLAGCKMSGTLPAGKSCIRVVLLCMHALPQNLENEVLAPYG